MTGDTGNDTDSDAGRDAVVCSCGEPGCRPVSLDAAARMIQVGDENIRFLGRKGRLHRTWDGHAWQYCPQSLVEHAHKTALNGHKITAEEAARIIGTTAPYIRQLGRDGTLMRFEQPDGAVRFSHAHVLKFARRRAKQAGDSRRWTPIAVAARELYTTVAVVELLGHNGWLTIKHGDDGHQKWVLIEDLTAITAWYTRSFRGDLLRQLRNEHRWTKGVLAKKVTDAGFPTTSLFIQQAEACYAYPNPMQATVIAEVLGRDVKDFYHHQEQTVPTEPAPGIGPVTPGLNDDALAVLALYGFTEAQWTARHFGTNSVWGGDACGCPDDRCIGHHHNPTDECGCLTALLQR